MEVNRRQRHLSFGISFASIPIMLKICSDQLTDTPLGYIALRLAFHDTLERISLATQVGLSQSGDFGFLTEVPFLRSTAPQVQLEALLGTWQKMRSSSSCEADLIDESVIYAACETAARVVECDWETAARVTATGPRAVGEFVDGTLADHLRFMHLNLPNEGDFLLLSQFQDVPPEESRRLKAKFGLDAEFCEPMFELLSRWRVSKDFWPKADGLLTRRELEHAQSTLEAALGPMPR